MELRFAKWEVRLSCLREMSWERVDHTRWCERGNVLTRFFAMQNGKQQEMKTIGGSAEAAQ